MNIALVGKFTANSWGAEHSVQRGFWALGHEVQTVELIKECQDDQLMPGPEYDRDPEDYEYVPARVNTDARALRGVALTIVMQGYRMLPETIEEIRRNTGNPVVCWHGEVLSPDWPSDDPVVQLKAEQLQKNAMAFDLVLHNCTCCLTTVKALGAKKVAWCPVNGVDPRLHQRQSSQKVFDVGIYGWASPRRLQIVQEVIRHLGRGVRVAWPDAGSDGVYGTALVNYLNAVRVTLNVHFSQTLNTENRLYESLGCGTPCVSEPISMPDLFPMGLGILYGETPEALAEGIQRLLRLPDDEYAGMAEAGYRLVHDEYTYRQRCQQLLEAVAKELG